MTPRIPSPAALAKLLPDEKRVRLMALGRKDFEYRVTLLQKAYASYHFGAQSGLIRTVKPHWHSGEME